MRLEKDVVGEIRLALQALGTTLFRNTVGRFQAIDQRGSMRWIQTGLCVGSSDYIGFTEYEIQPQDVGRKVALFTAVETKRPSGGKRTFEQTTFIDRVKAAGGIAGFASSAQQARDLVEGYKNGQHY